MMMSSNQFTNLTDAPATTRRRYDPLEEFDADPTLQFLRNSSPPMNERLLHRHQHHQNAALSRSRSPPMRGASTWFDEQQQQRQRASDNNSKVMQMIRELKEELRSNTRSRCVDREENRREWTRADSWNSGIETRVFKAERELDHIIKTLRDIERRVATLKGALLHQSSTACTQPSNYQGAYFTRDAEQVADDARDFVDKAFPGLAKASTTTMTSNAKE